VTPAEPLGIGRASHRQRAQCTARSSDASHVSTGEAHSLTPGATHTHRATRDAPLTAGAERVRVQVADLIHKGVQIAQEVKKATTPGKLVDFKKYLADNELPALAALKAEVKSLASGFPMPGL
jgi:hypothetical protein